MAKEVVITATARKRSPGHDRRGGAAGPDRAHAPIRLAGVLSDERRAECMASGTLQFDGDVVIGRHARGPPGTGIVGGGGAWGLGAPPRARVRCPPMAHGYGSSTDLRL